MTRHSKTFVPVRPVAGASMDFAVEPVSIDAGGATLAGLFYGPKGETRAVAVLNGAVGVPQRFYRAFAEWLAGTQGIGCLTYDYTGFGASATGHARRSDANLALWGLRDQPAAMRTARALMPDLPVWVIGHSFGGVMLAFNGQAAGAARIITLGSGLVHLTDHPWPYRLAATAFWYGHGPILTTLAGYLPGRLAGLGSDLPAGIYWQWRRWATTRGFALSDVGRGLPLPQPGSVTAPMRIVAVEDDVMVPPRAVWRQMALAPEAIKTQKVLRPGDLGLTGIGHIGAFARQNSVVWPDIIA
jgi:predicted alpha/beta hydrolase